MVLRKAGEEAEDAASEGLLTAAAIVRIMCLWRSPVPRPDSLTRKMRRVSALKFAYPRHAAGAWSAQHLADGPRGLNPPLLLPAAHLRPAHVRRPPPATAIAAVRHGPGAGVWRVVATVLRPSGRGAAARCEENLDCDASAFPEHVFAENIQPGGVYRSLTFLISSEG